ncbi:MAG: PQQ-like beta-propeller repeat protein [Candidatus Obscuribacter sp.]|nr:PQQ-like beta-propeller repeat protein [Candidatus Obscuribacter sp.]
MQLISLTGTKWKAGAAESFSIAAAGPQVKVYVGNDDPKLYCYDAHTGKVEFGSPSSTRPRLCSRHLLQSLGGMILW